MSTSTHQEITCAKCGAKHKLNAWASVTAVRNPELRLSILNETLFNWTCDKCGYRAMVVYPLLYHDPEHRFMVALNPDDQARRLEAPPLVDGLKKRTVRLPAELKEKILIFEAGLDDVTIELIKLLVSAPLQEKYGAEHMRLYFCSQSAGAVTFAAFVPGRAEPFYESAGQKFYDQCLDIAREAEFDTTGFLTVDEHFAQRIMNRYQNLHADAEEN